MNNGEFEICVMAISNFIEKNILNSICCEMNRTRPNDYNYDVSNGKKFREFLQPARSKLPYSRQQAAHSSPYKGSRVGFPESA